MEFEEIKARLEKYTLKIEGKLVKKVDKVNFDEVDFGTPNYDFINMKPITITIGKPGKCRSVCPRCGATLMISRLMMFRGQIWFLLCRNCKKEIAAISKELIAKGYVFKHGFEKAVKK